MSHALCFMHSPRSSSRTSRLLGLMACLLVGIHIVAEYVCVTCTYPTEEPAGRSFHLHSGDDRDPCRHGRPEPNPLTAWACAVTQDESAFILPEIPRLPVVVSLFVPLVLLLVSYGNRPLVAAHSRGPPYSIA